MNSFEKGGKGKEDAAATTELCRKAIEVYLKTLRTKPDGTISEMSLQDAERSADNDAEMLRDHGAEGLRYGGRRSSHIKLRFLNGQFFLDSNREPPEIFEAWQQEIGKKFEEEGLPFKYTT